MAREMIMRKMQEENISSGVVCAKEEGKMELLPWYRSKKRIHACA